MFNAGGPVVCEAESNDNSQQHTAHCHVNHSSNTVPVFSCPASATTDEDHSDLMEVYVNQCAYDKIFFNTTTFTVHIADNFASFTCTVRYTAVGNSSVVYSEEQFLIFDGSIKPITDDDTFQKDNKPSGKSGKKYTECISKNISIYYTNI